MFELNGKRRTIRKIQILLLNTQTPIRKWKPGVDQKNRSYIFSNKPIT